MKAWPLLALLLAAPPAEATELKLGSLTFSDELGGVVLKGGSGTGTVADPFVLIEDITDDGPAVLVIRGMRQQFGNTLGTPHLVGFSIRKIVTNRTRRDWYDFELELREILTRASPYEDGLSFGQAGLEMRPFTADRYARVQLRDEPLGRRRLLRRPRAAGRDRDGDGLHHRLLAELRVLPPAAAREPVGAAGTAGSGRSEAQPRRWVPWVTAAPARSAAATNTVSAISSCVAPALIAAFLWISRQ